MSKGKVLMAMSGGLDSTIASLLLHEQGYQVIGITMKTWDYETSGGSNKETGCCSLDSINDARKLAVDCGFPHMILDIREEFGDYIIDNFVDEYIAGRTPNPCVLCNTHIKWEALLKRADMLGCKYIATGHYAQVREQIGIVPQDTFLFGGSILENIAYGKTNSTESEVKEAAKQANTHEFITEFEDGYNTLVGERGIQLSGGQRQRISIARTILKNPAILILDEATSSLDSHSERIVQTALDQLMKKRTTIVIAHRLSTIKSADEIHVIDHGKIVESGTHEELINIDNGSYQSLCKLQYFKE
ncbi:ATP-binding cassette domain-containing protein [bacterium]|nr:ATP-binding cassette domain-containing protein [bacterium]